MSTGLDDLISDLYSDYRVKKPDVIKFENFLKNKNMDRYALFDDIKQTQFDENNKNSSNNSSETIQWLISNSCYDTIYPLIIEFMSQYATDPKREEMLQFLTKFLESFTCQSRHKQSMKYLKRFQLTLSKLFIHQKQFIKNMNDNRLTLNLRYYDEYNQFCPLLTIIIDKIYQSFDNNHFIHAFEYLNIFQLFLGNGANPLHKSSNGALSFQTTDYKSSIIYILDVLYGIYPMIIKFKQSENSNCEQEQKSENESVSKFIVEELVTNKYLSLLTYGKINDSDDMESWFPTIITIKRNTQNNSTCVSYVNDAYLCPYLYKSYAHTIEQQQCIHSIYCLKRLLIRGFNIIDIQKNGFINVLISKSEIIKNICDNINSNYINNSLLRSKIILLLWTLRILIIEIRDEFINEFHKIYNESYDEFKEDCGGEAISYSVWIMIMDYGIVNKLTFLNQIDDNFLVHNSAWNSLHCLAPDIIIFIFNNILNKLSENHLKVISQQIDNYSYNIIEIFKILLFKNINKKYDNTVIMKVVQYLLINNNWNNKFLIQQLYDNDLMEKIFWNERNYYNINNNMLQIYSDTMGKFYQFNYEIARNYIPINTNILNKCVNISINQTDSILENKIKAMFPQKLMQLCSIQLLNWCLFNVKKSDYMFDKLKFVIDRQWLHVLALIINENNKQQFHKILEQTSDSKVLKLLLSYLNANINEFKNENNYKEIKQKLCNIYFNIHFKFHQNGNIKCAHIVQTYMNMFKR